MNKLILDKEKKELVIKEDTICDIDYEITLLNIKVLDNVKFIINHYVEIKDNNMIINVEQNNNSEFIYNHRFKNIGNYNIEININMNGNESKNLINIRGLSDRGKTNIIVDGSVKENTINNVLDEKIKMLNINNGKSSVLPNMFINTKNVIANHSVSITDIDEDYLFYLNSKGIDNNKAKELIINGFLNK